MDLLWAIVRFIEEGAAALREWKRRRTKPSETQPMFFFCLCKTVAKCVIYNAIQ